MPATLKGQLWGREGTQDDKLVRTYSEGYLVEVDDVGEGSKVAMTAPGLPAMYEPTWLPPGKLLSALAEASTALLAVAGFLVSWRMRRTRQRTSDR